jgi:hypothetical protein
VITSSLKVCLPIPYVCHLGECIVNWSLERNQTIPELSIGPLNKEITALLSVGLNGKVDTIFYVTLDGIVEISVVEEVVYKPEVDIYLRHLDQ